MIKYLIMDVDGTLTDGKIYMSDNGELMKAYNIKDGYGIHNILMNFNIEPIIITGRESKIVLHRCSELGINKIFQGVTDKGSQLLALSLDLSEVAYIGDDLNDFSCMIMVKESGGVIGCPRDAVQEIINISNFVAEHDGGDGAVRDFIDYLVKKI